MFPLAPTLASLSFARSESLPTLALLAAALTALLLWSYRSLPMPPGRRTAAFLLKLSGFCLLLLCWLEPQWLSLAPKQRAHSVAFLLDNSLSMRLPAAPGSPSRGSQLLQTWLPASEWRHSLEKQFRLRSFTFGNALRELPKETPLLFHESPSSLASALSQLQERLAEKPAAIVLLTDGAASDLTDFAPQNLPPIHPVIFGQPLPTPDLSLGNLTTTLSAFEDAPVSILAEVRATGLGPTKVRVQLEPVDPPPLPGASPILAETSVEVRPEQGRALARLQFEPLRTGPSFYRIRIDAPGLPPNSELTLENNTRLLCVNRSSGPHSLLYVAGRPNWEFGPMRRALESDPELQLRALIRVAKREPKFTFKGRSGESSNPLFRGFQNGENNPVQRYDQPVLVRVNVDNAQELAAGFPKTAEELFAFKALILDDLEAEFFSPEQLRLLQRFVTERGGGLLMLGGMESFEGGAWHETPVENILPVWIGKHPLPTTSTTAETAWQLTRDGLLTPWLRRRPSETDETQRIRQLPKLEILNNVQGIKPAASVLALAVNAEGERPAMVMQRSGLGRTAALLAGDLFHWGIGNPEHAKDLAKLWRQIARWLVSDTPNPVDLHLVSPPNAPLTQLLIRVRDPQAQPVENANVQVQVRRIGEPESAAVTLLAQPAPEPGTYTLEYPGTIQAALIARASAQTVDGTPLGSGTLGWVQDTAEAEWNAASPNLDPLRALAHKTGGALASPTELDALVKRIQNAPHLVTETRTRPLWHSSPFFLAALLCLVAEWTLRRRNGAA